MTNLRDWQKEGFKKIQKCDSADDHSVIPVNACVGSGKTMEAALAYADFIQKHRAEKTIQMFVTPRIKLCAQQSKELADKIASYDPSIQFKTFPEKSKFSIIQVDCEHMEWSRKNDYLDIQHIIFIVCEASLWGKDENDTEKRWNAWKGRLSAWQEQGYIFGTAAFDEAHNYSAADKVEKMFGQTLITSKSVIDWKSKKCMLHWFHNVMLLSGTPSNYQKELSHAYKRSVCSCSLKTAIENHWVEKPVLNLVKYGYSAGAETYYSNAVIKVLEREEKLGLQNGVRMLVNFGSIDEIKAFTEDPYIKESMGKRFKLVTIHSDKAIMDGDTKADIVTSRIDGEKMKSGEVYEWLEGMDDEVFEMPVIVCQVAMIGEGINIKSFSSVITKTNSDVSAMQQIGRALRLFPGKSSPNVYCMFDNVDSLKMLLANLSIEHDLTADVFKWGDKIDLSTGSSMEDKVEKDAADGASIGWEKINPEINAEICEIEYSPEFQSKSASFYTRQLTESGSLLPLMKYMRFFDDEFCRKISGKMRTADREDAMYKATKRASQKAMKQMQKEAEKMQEAEKVASASMQPKTSDITQKFASEEEVAAQEAAEQPAESQPVDPNSQQMKTIINILNAVRHFILTHKKQPKVISNANEHLTALTDYLFSYNKSLADAVRCSGICDDKTFRKAVGL